MVKHTAVVQRCRVVAWLLAASMLSSCGLPNPYVRNQDSMAAQRVENDAEFLDNSYVQACGAGIAMAVLAAWATADGDDHSLARYLTASGIGCGVALGANFMLQKIREGYRVKQEDKLAALNTLKQENIRITRLISSTQTLVSEDKQLIQQTRAAYQSRQLSLTEARSRLSQVDQHASELRQTLAKLERRKQEWIQLQAALRNSQSSTEQQVMQLEIDGLQQKVAVLKQELLELERARSVSSIG